MAELVNKTEQLDLANTEPLSKSQKKRLKKKQVKGGEKDGSAEDGSAGSRAVAAPPLSLDGDGGGGPVSPISAGDSAVASSNSGGGAAVAACDSGNASIAAPQLSEEQMRKLLAHAKQAMDDPCSSGEDKVKKAMEALGCVATVLTNQRGSDGAAEYLQSFSASDLRQADAGARAAQMAEAARIAEAARSAQIAQKVRHRKAALAAEKAGSVQGQEANH